MRERCVSRAARNSAAALSSWARCSEQSNSMRWAPFLNWSPSPTVMCRIFPAIWLESVLSSTAVISAGISIFAGGLAAAGCASAAPEVAASIAASAAH